MGNVCGWRLGWENGLAGWAGWATHGMACIFIIYLTLHSRCANFVSGEVSCFTTYTIRIKDQNYGLPKPKLGSFLKAVS